MTRLYVELPYIALRKVTLRYIALCCIMLSYSEVYHNTLHMINMYVTARMHTWPNAKMVSWTGFPASLGQLLAYVM